MKDVIVKVIVGSSKNCIEHFGDNRYLVRLETTEDNQINKDVLEALSKYTGTPQQRIQLISGVNSLDKVFRIV